MRRNVRLTAPGGTALAALRPDLAAAVGADPRAPLYGDGDLLVSDLPLGSPGFRHGSLLQFGVPTARPAAGAVELHTVSGPLAGRRFPLRLGVSIVGRTADCAIALDDADVSRKHAVFDVRPGRILLHDCGSTNGTRINGRAVGRRAVEIAAGDLIQVGETVLTVSLNQPVAGAPYSVSGGRRQVTAAPRMPERVLPTVIDLPVEPGGRGAMPVQWLTALLPATAGAGIAWLTHNLEFLAFALLSPVVVLAQALSDRVTGRRHRRRGARRLAAARAAATKRAARLMAEEAARLRHAFPDPVQTARTARLPGARLWERRAADVDALQVRVGLGCAPSIVTLRRVGQAESAGQLPLVPVRASLGDGPLGLVGPPTVVVAVARWVVAQLTVALPPGELRIVPLVGDTRCPDGADWSSLRWLPHLPRQLAGSSSPAPLDLLGQLTTDAKTALDRRLPSPWTVLVVDEHSAALPEVTRLLELGPAARATAVAVAGSSNGLPATCRTLGRVSGETPTRLQLVAPDGSVAADVLADQVAAQWSDEVARSLAWTEQAGRAPGGDIPDTVRLLDLLDLNDPAPHQLMANWAQRRAPSVPLALSARGPVSVDLASDGPHALVAGTTGAGKSELLQSLIAGLAATQPPTELNFVLIDYKGGAAFGECAGLPHTVAVATDLDAHLTRRALLSFEAELRRRETVLAHAGVASVDALANRGGAALARLVIVVDEFAALAQDLPDFIPGLVSIAQRGRSLGLHLVLATQRPGGVVSPEIRANSALRIGLRMTDPGESSDVVGSDAASRFSTSAPGRAIIRTGISAVEVQTARISGPAPVGAESVRLEILTDGEGDLRRGHLSADRIAEHEQTDLQLLVAAAREAAAHLHCSPPRSPWLPSLPTSLPARTRGAAVQLGLVDLPAEQHQAELLVDFGTGNPLLLVGGPGSGRTSALRTVAAAGGSASSPDDLHVYVLDFTGGATDLGALPHCGAALTGEDMTIVAALLEHLVETAAERQQQPEPAGRPAIVLLLDGWESFVAASEQFDSGRCVELVYALLRDGRSSAVTVVIAGDRAALSGQLPRLVEQKVVLRLADLADYILAGIAPKSLPGRLPPGRGLLWNTGYEVQLGFVGSDASEAAQRAAVASVAGLWPASSRPPTRFRRLPRKIRLPDLPGGDDVLLGVGGHDAAAVAVRLTVAGTRLLIAGPPRSGRSTALVTVLHQVAGRVDCVVAASTRSPLRPAAEAAGVRVLSPDEDLAADPAGKRTLVLVDDAESLTDTGLGDRLSDRLRNRPEQISVVVAARLDDLAVAYRGLLFDLRRSGAAVLLNPGPGDGELVGIRLPRARASRAPGRGYAVLGDLLARGPGHDPFPIQIAVP